MSQANQLKGIVNEYVEWLRHGSITMAQFRLDVKGRCLMPNERAYIKYWVAKCIKEGRYL